MHWHNMYKNVGVSIQSKLHFLKKYSSKKLYSVNKLDKTHKLKKINTEKQENSKPDTENFGDA